MKDNFLGRKQFEYMYNPCSFGVEKHFEAVAPREKIVLAVGRLVALKNFEELLDIWSMIEDEATDWVLRIVGSGSSEKELKNRAISLGINNSVKFVGYSNNVDVEMSKASVYAMTSLCEGFGLVLVEAQHAGLPCVSYDLPYGPSEIINDGDDGFLIENHNKTKFAQKLLELIKDQDLRNKMSINAYQNSKKFDSGIIADEWMKRFNSLLNRK